MVFDFDVPTSIGKEAAMAETESCCDTYVIPVVDEVVSHYGALFDVDIENITLDLGEVKKEEIPIKLKGMLEDEIMRHLYYGLQKQDYENKRLGKNKVEASSIIEDDGSFLPDMGITPALIPCFLGSTPWQYEGSEHSLLHDLWDEVSHIMEDRSRADLFFAWLSNEPMMVYRFVNWLDVDQLNLLLVSPCLLGEDIGLKVLSKLKRFEESRFSLRHVLSVIVYALIRQYKKGIGLHDAMEENEKHLYEGGNLSHVYDDIIAFVLGSTFSGITMPTLSEKGTELVSEEIRKGTMPDLSGGETGLTSEGIRKDTKPNLSEKGTVLASEVIRKGMSGGEAGFTSEGIRKDTTSILSEKGTELASEGNRKDMMPDLSRGETGFTSEGIRKDTEPNLSEKGTELASEGNRKGMMPDLSRGETRLAGEENGKDTEPNLSEKGTELAREENLKGMMPDLSGGGTGFTSEGIRKGTEPNLSEKGTELASEENRKGMMPDLSGGETGLTGEENGKDTTSVLSEKGTELANEEVRKGTLTDMPKSGGIIEGDEIQNAGFNGFEMIRGTDGVMRKRKISGDEEHLNLEDRRNKYTGSMEENKSTEDNEELKAFVERLDVYEKDMMVQKERLLEETDLPNGKSYYVDDAGLVLLHPFLLHLFNRLGFLDEDQEFKSLDVQERAVCLLRFMAGYRPPYRDYQLALEKVICDLPLAFPVSIDTELKKEDLEEARQVLEAVCQYWKPLNGTSPEVLQQSFIRRAGNLAYEDGAWIVRIEGQTLDILLDDLPWEISLLLFPWKDDMIMVEWQRE